MSRFFLLTNEINERNVKNNSKGLFTLISRKFMKSQLKGYCPYINVHENINMFVYLYYYCLLNKLSGSISVFYSNEIDNINQIEEYYSKIIEVDEMMHFKDNFIFFKVKIINYLGCPMIKSFSLKEDTFLTYFADYLKRIRIPVLQFQKLLKPYFLKHSFIEDTNNFLQLFYLNSDKIILVGNRSADKNLSQIIDNKLVIRFNLNVPSRFNYDENRGERTDLLFMGDPVRNYFFCGKDKKIESAFDKNQLDYIDKLLKNGLKAIVRKPIYNIPLLSNNKSYIINNLNVNSHIFDNIIMSVAVCRWKLSDQIIYRYNKQKKHLTSGVFMIFFLLAIGIKPSIVCFCRIDDVGYIVDYSNLVKEEKKGKYENVRTLAHHDVNYEKWLINELKESNVINILD